MPIPNQEMRAEARRGLELRREYGRGGTEIGVARARDISNGKNLSLDTVRRMRSYFARHEVDKQGKGWKRGEEGFPSAGYIAWKLWGGDPGRSWANRILREEQSMSEMEVPRSALNWTPEGGSSFEYVEGTEKDKRPRFRMVANSGGVIPHGYWGNFAVDLEGIKTSKKKLPILLEHDNRKIVGHSTSIEITQEGLVAEGVFADTESGREVRELLEAGHPWQASVSIPPRKIEKVNAGEFADVNGTTLEGPGHIFRESSLRECSFCALGADEDTSATTFSNPVTINAVLTATETEVQMDRPEPDAVEETASVSDQAETEVKAQLSDGLVSDRDEERTRVQAFVDHCLPQQLSMVSELISEGVSQEEGLKRLLDNAKEEMSEKLNHKLTSTPEPVGPLEEETTDPSESFAADKELVKEFGTFEVYEAYQKAVDRGAVSPGKRS